MTISHWIILASLVITGAVIVLDAKGAYNDDTTPPCPTRAADHTMPAGIPTPSYFLYRHDDRSVRIKDYYRQNKGCVSTRWRLHLN